MYWKNTNYICHRLIIIKQTECSQKADGDCRTIIATTDRCNARVEHSWLVLNFSCTVQDNMYTCAELTTLPERRWLCVLLHIAVWELQNYKYGEMSKLSDAYVQEGDERPGCTYHLHVNRQEAWSTWNNHPMYKRYSCIIRSLIPSFLPSFLVV